MISIWVALIGCLVLTAILAKVLVGYAPALRLLVAPSEHRQHALPTPVVGGIAMVVSMFVFVCLSQPQYLPLFVVLGGLLLVGIVDDISHLPSSLRLLAQAISVYLLIEITGVKLTSLGYLVGEEPVLLGKWAYPFTIFAGIGLINAINMSDGMDGLAGTLILVCGGSLLIVGTADDSLILLLGAATLGFLYWNARWFRSRAALFMGDAGSTVIGLLFTYLLIRATQEPDAVMAPVTALWVLALPLIDTVALLLVRPLRGRSPLTADNLHYHHLIGAFGLSVNCTLALVAVLQIGLSILGLSMAYNDVAESVQLNLFLLLFGLYAMFLLYQSKPRS
jgi:UDP-GlcNAc:undecaprenyl-phosphate GlcNAc-1-phosphate transferase